MMKLSKRIVLVGRAASGKDFFKNYLIEKGFIPSVSHTTRPMRDGEINGDTYEFVSEEDFTFMTCNDQFFEYKMFNGWGYGTSQLMWDTAEVFIFTPEGIRSLPQSDIDESTIVYFDIPMDVRMSRMEERSDCDSISRRLAADNVDFDKFDNFDIKVTKPDFDPQELLKLIITHSIVC